MRYRFTALFFALAATWALTQFVFVADGHRLGGNGRCGMGSGAVDANTLPVKPGYTKVEVQMPKDDRKRPESEQEQ